MLITFDSRQNLYHVILVELQTEQGQTLRSFATSEQLVAWLKLNPGSYRLVTNVKGVELATPFESYYNIPSSDTSAPLNPAPLDIVCDQQIQAFKNGVLTQLVATGGTSGWG